MVVTSSSCRLWVQQQLPFTRSGQLLQLPLIPGEERVIVAHFILTTLYQESSYQSSYPSYPQTYPSYSSQPYQQYSYSSSYQPSYSWSYQPSSYSYQPQGYSSQAQTPVYNYMINELPMNYFGPDSSSDSSSSSTSSSGSPIITSLSVSSSAKTPAWQGIMINVRRQ